MFPERLTSGYRAFLAGRFSEERSRYQSLAAAGQSPETMLIGCVDSRVSPELIFGAAPGEILVVRNVANLVPPYEPHSGAHHGVSAALEFGVIALGVRHIVVLGHEFCGGVKAFVKSRERLTPSDFIGRWMSQIEPAAKRLGSKPEQEGETWLRRLEYLTVENSLDNLLTFPWIASRVQKGSLELHGAYFGIASGRLLIRDPKSARFEPAFPNAPDQKFRCDP